MNRSGKPLLLRMLARTARRDPDRALAGDIEEMYRWKAREHAFRARVWLFVEAVRLVHHRMADGIFWRFVMFNNYAKAALRHMRRNRVYSSIKVFSLAVGMACCMLILLWVRHELSYDRYHEHADRLYRILYGMQEEGDRTYFAVSPFAAAPAFAAAIPEIVAYTRLDRMGPGLIRLGDRTFEESGIYYVDPGFFRLFSHAFLSGEPGSALEEPGSVVLTENRARKLFGTADAAGRILHLEEEGELTVRGVVADIPGNSHMEFEYLVSNHHSQRRFTDLYASWDWMRGWSYVLLERGADPDDVIRKLEVVMDAHATGDQGWRGGMTLQPVTDIHLKSNLLGELAANGKMSNVVAFSVIAGFLLLIACINFMNLATARSMERSREVGMRKVLGAHRSHLMVQFLGEAVITACVALLLSTLLVTLALPVFNRITMKSFSVSVITDPFYWAGGFALILLTGLFAGSYPAFALSAFRPVRTLQKTATGGKGGAAFRDALVVLQFAVSITLISSTATIWKQTRHMKNQDLGFDQENVLFLDLRSEGIRQQAGALKSALLRHPGIRTATVSYGIPGQVYTTRGMVKEGQEMNEELDVALLFCDYDFLETYGIEILYGRNFSPSRGTDAGNAFLINETAARAWGWGADAVGKQIGHGPGEMGRIIGVVKDFYGQAVRSRIEPMAIRLTEERISSISMKVDPVRLEEILAYVEGVWGRFEPNRSFEWNFTDAYLDRYYGAEERLNGLLGAFTVIAVLVACLGLFGLAAFTAEQRTKEIGIRRVLGAPVLGLTAGLTRGFLMRVLWSSLAAAPAAYLLMGRFLEDYASRITRSAYLFVLPAALAMLVAMLTVSSQAFRAARANPAESLKVE